MNTAKTYIPDTNIAIDDAYFLREFLRDKENKVILPDVVIGEIDRLKKHPEVGFEAREFMNYLFSIIGDNSIVTDGIRIPLTADGNMTGGRLFITNQYKSDDSKDILTMAPDIGPNDLNIIRAAAIYKLSHPNEDVILVSNDKNVVTVARMNGIKAEYMRKEAADPTKLSRGYRLITPKKGLFNYISQNPDRPIPLSEIDESFTEELIANEYVVFLNDRIQQAIDASYRYNNRSQFSIEPRYIKRYDIELDALVTMDYRNQSLHGFTARNLEQVLCIDQLLNKKIHIKATRADAGTGKSFLELLVALYKTVQARKNKVDDAKVYIIRRAVFMEEYGWLPGDMVDKNKHTYEGVERNYAQIMGVFADNAGLESDYATKLFDALKEEDGLIEVLPFGTIRGITIGPNAIVIGEEWQNTEIKFTKIMMDRNGDGEVYINGDSNQTDNPHTSPERNGLTYMFKRIEDASRKARKTRDALHLFDASICGVMTLQHSERGIISGWSQRNIPPKSR